MKMQKVLKSSVKYPTHSNIKPIIFSAVAIIALSGCGTNKLPPQKVIKPLSPIHLNIDKNSTKDVEPVEPAIAGAPLACPIKK